MLTTLAGTTRIRLVESAAMRPYLNLIAAALKNQDNGPALAALKALPLESRYVWRIASALM